MVLLIESKVGLKLFKNNKYDESTLQQNKSVSKHFQAYFAIHL